MLKAKSSTISPPPPYIQKASPYVPGKPLEELERELGISSIIKLASNENPLGASPLALEVLKNSLPSLSHYPDTIHHYLRTKLAEKNKIPMEEIFIGNGSNEIFDLIIRGFCTPRDNIISCGAAFLAYKICSDVHNVEYREAPLREDLVADLDEMLKLVDENTKIIFLANPNNPTGTYVNKDSLIKFLKEVSKKNIITVLDYAYCEYVEAKDYAQAEELYNEFPNILISKTFSKIHGLAALRVGYAFSHSDILGPLWKVKMPFNVNGLALQAALAAIEDEEHIKKSFELNREGLSFLSKKIDALGFKQWPSQANFLLVDFKEHAKELNQYLLKNGIIIRPIVDPLLPTHIRITAGLESENKKLVDSLENFFHTREKGA